MHRNSQNILDNKIEVEEVIDAIQFDKSLMKQWEIYQKKHEYAKNIDFSQLIESIIDIKNIYFN